jgi:hypothetical protein
MQQELATQAILSGEGGEGAAGESIRWITTAAQMGLGFILPFALVFVAIPLETFVQSLRTVLGLVGVGLLRALAFFLRLLSSGSRYLGQLLVDLYDLVIFAPLWIEGKLSERNGAVAEAVAGGGGQAKGGSGKTGSARSSRSGRTASTSQGSKTDQGETTGEESA